LNTFCIFPALDMNREPLTRPRGRVSGRRIFWPQMDALVETLGGLDRHDFVARILTNHANRPSLLASNE
jgi:hypothetical protein